MEENMRLHSARSVVAKGILAALLITTSFASVVGAAPSGVTVAGAQSAQQDEDTKKKDDEKKNKAGRVMRDKLRDRLERIVRAWNAMRGRQA
jgi:hypothetical protein